MNDWRLEQGILCCTVSGRPVTVRPAAKDSSVKEATPLLAPSLFCLYEWDRYVVEGPTPLCVWVKDRDVEPLGNGLTLFSYANQIGRSVIRVQAGGQRLPLLPVEILSPKRPTPTEHLRFYRALVDDLAARATRLPFVVAAPTGIPASESPRPPTPLFVYHFLRQHASDLRAALAAMRSLWSTGFATFA